MKRSIALFLSLVMLFSLLPASALAEEFEVEELIPEEVFVLEAEPEPEPEPEPEAPTTEEPEPVPDLPEEPAVLWCEVTFDLCGHGEPIDPLYVPCGSTVEKPEDPRADGYAFAGWYGDAEHTWLWDFD